MHCKYVEEMLSSNVRRIDTNIESQQWDSDTVGQGALTTFHTQKNANYKVTPRKTLNFTITIEFIHLNLQKYLLGTHYLPDLRTMELNLL